MSKRRVPGPDMRFPGEAFCSDCPDREGCATAYPCDLVRRINLGGADDVVISD